MITTNSTSTYAMSVRCVLDLILKHKTCRLQLCDNSSGSYGALRCNYKDVCTGATNNRCYPYNVWSGTLNSGTSYYRGNLNGGSFTVNSNSYTNANGVRCVLDLKIYRQAL